LVFSFSSRRRHTMSKRDWSSDVCSSDLRRRVLTQCEAVDEQAPSAVAVLGWLQRSRELLPPDTGKAHIFGHAAISPAGASWGQSAPPVPGGLSGCLAPSGATIVT